MRRLSPVQAIARRQDGYGGRVRLAVSILLVLLFVPGWTGDVRLPLLDRDTTLAARGVPVPPAQRRLGRLTLVGLVDLASPAPAFGGFSAIAVRRGRVTLLNDGGNWVAFGIRRGHPADARAGYLSDGPDTGWKKRDRDSESLAVDPVSGTMWVGFENANAIWRYAPGFRRAEARARPPAMAGWRDNGGAETLVRLADGRFLTISEERRRPSRLREGVLFSGDPTQPATTATRFGYRPPAGYDPSDAAQLPGGDLLVLNRRFSLPYNFSAKLVCVPLADIRAGGVVAGREIATIGPPSLEENWEGVAVTREGGATMVWLVADEDVAALQRTLLAKFRLD